MKKWKFILGVDVSKLTLDVHCLELNLHILWSNVLNSKHIESYYYYALGGPGGNSHFSFFVDNFKEQSRGNYFHC